MAVRFHRAGHWTSRAGWTYRCKFPDCGFETSTGTEHACQVEFRQHRRDMGENVPESPWHTEFGFYALWVTRNGQHQWSGPHTSRRLAWGSMDALLYCTDQKVIGPRSIHRRRT